MFPDIKTPGAAVSKFTYVHADLCLKAGCTTPAITWGTSTNGSTQLVNLYEYNCKIPFNFHAFDNESTALANVQPTYTDQTFSLYSGDNVSIEPTSDTGACSGTYTDFCPGGEAVGDTGCAEADTTTFFTDGKIAMDSALVNDVFTCTLPAASIGGIITTGLLATATMF